MKKTILVLMLALGIAFGVFCQAPSGPVDLILILDTSASMSSSYRETSDYLIGPFLREFLRIGDTFHLISFAKNPKFEISRRIEGAGDMEVVIGRLLLMYPLDPESDVAGALGFAENYSSSLPGNRPKKLVLVSDGDAPGTQNLVESGIARIRGRGADLQYIRVPVSGSGPSSGRPVGAAQTAQAAAQTTPPRQTEAASQQQPASSQGQAAAQSAAQAAQPASQPTQGQAPAAANQGTPADGVAPAAAQAAQPVSGPGQAASQPSASQPAASQPAAAQPSASQTAQPPDQGAAQTTTQPTGEQPPSARQDTPAAQGMAREPDEKVEASRPSRTSSGSSIPLPFLIALAVLALLILGLLIFFAARRLHDSPNRVMAQAAAPDYSDRVDAGKDTAKGVDLMDSYAAAQRNQRKPLPKDKVYMERPENTEGPLLLNLFVEDQNTAIGRRNIHLVKSGYTFSIGGGKSDFLIFLVPVPPHIADVVFDGRNCTFIPRKPQYFPDIGSQQVPACIGKTIRVISDKNYELYIRIERYEDPLAALNKILHSISVPGPAK